MALSPTEKNHKSLVDDVGSDDGAQWFPTGKNLAVSEFGGMWIFYLYY